MPQYPLLSSKFDSFSSGPVVRGREGCHIVAIGVVARDGHHDASPADRKNHVRESDASAFARAAARECNPLMIPSITHAGIYVMCPAVRTLFPESLVLLLSLSRASGRLPRFHKATMQIFIKVITLCTLFGLYSRPSLLLFFVFFSSDTYRAQG